MAAYAFSLSKKEKIVSNAKLQRQATKEIKARLLILKTFAYLIKKLFQNKENISRGVGVESKIHKPGFKINLLRKRKQFLQMKLFLKNEKRR